MRGLCWRFAMSAAFGGLRSFISRLFQTRCDWASEGAVLGTGLRWRFAMLAAVAAASFFVS